MIDLCIFLNSRVENSGNLAWIADKGLAPFRYLFNGKTICIQQFESDQEVSIHHVASFHKNGSSHHSRTSFSLESSSTSMIKSALSVGFLIPGLIIGAAFKGLAYLSSSVRDNHRLAKEHLTPIDRLIGSVSNPIVNRSDLCKALQKERSDPKNRPTNALIIHGDGKLTINEDLTILNLNPMRLILQGVKIVPKSSISLDGRLDDGMRSTGKWIYPSINSFKEALEEIAPWRSWTSCKRYHMVFTLARPKAV